MEDPKPWLTLARAPGLHAGLLAELFARGEPPTTLLRESRSGLAALGLNEAITSALCQPDAIGIDEDMAWLEGGSNRRLVTWRSPEYPMRLAEIADAPLVLYVEGDASILWAPQLAIVGSRNPTGLGSETATQFAAQLVRAGLVITSGLALGIDAAAHRGALRADGRTVAVVGRGLDCVYPRENKRLAREIVEQGGALVSDFPIGVPPLKQNFPRRNRILSGLSLGTLVVEAALQSGSLITARLAGEQGRDVFAIPGSIHNPLARGCHKLLRDGARLVEGVEDIFAEIGDNVGKNVASIAQDTTKAIPADTSLLDKDYKILLDALGFEPASLDSVVARTGLKAAAVASMLLILELEGQIQQQPGGRYCRRLPRKA
jgi:DNA processing protein